MLRVSKLSRRSLLASVGGASLLPFVPLFNRDLEAQAGALPKRLVIVNIPNWRTDDQTRCEGTGADFTFSEAYKSLEPYRSDLLIVDGVDNLAAEDGGASGHKGNLALLTGIGPSGGAGGPSIDQWVAQQPDISTAVRSLVLGAGTRDEAGADDVISYAGKSQPIVPEADPAVVWSSLFQDFKADPTQRNTAKEANKGVLDNVATQLNNFKRFLPRDDQMKLEAHSQSIVELQQQLERAVYDCTVPPQPDAYPEHSTATMLQTSSLQMDLITTAMACDLTRVVSLYYGLERRGPTMDWVGATTHFHETSHGDPGSERYEMYSRGRAWLIEQYTSLVKRFKEMPEGNGSMLDNSVLVLTSCMGAAGRHKNYSVPFVLAGGAGGALSTGRYLRYGNYDVSGNGDAHGGETANRMLLSLAHAMGYPIDVFGNPDYCQGGPLADLLA
jgi:hypothetical protein